MITEAKRLTRAKAIRRKCLECCVENQDEVRKCIATKCPLHEYRFGKNPEKATNQRAKAIRLKCLDCSGFFAPDVRNCNIKDCHLYRYRTRTEVKD